MLEHVTVIYAMHAGNGSSRLGHFILLWFAFGFTSFLLDFN